jgi:hypothetical protein
MIDAIKKKKKATLMWCNLLLTYFMPSEELLLYEINHQNTDEDHKATVVFCIAFIRKIISHESNMFIIFYAHYFENYFSIKNCIYFIFNQLYYNELAEFIYRYFNEKTNFDSFLSILKSYETERFVARVIGCFCSSFQSNYYIGSC